METGGHEHLLSLNQASNDDGSAVERLWDIVNRDKASISDSVEHENGIFLRFRDAVNQLFTVSAARRQPGTAMLSTEIPGPLHSAATLAALLPPAMTILTWFSPSDILPMSLANFDNVLAEFCQCPWRILKCPWRFCQCPWRFCQCAWRFRIIRCNRQAALQLSSKPVLSQRKLALSAINKLFALYNY